MSMIDEEFYAFIDAAYAELEQKQAALGAQYGLGNSAGRWWFDQASSTLQFFDAADQLEMSADVIDIGSYSATANSWKWAWANEAVLPALRQRAEKIKTLEDITGNTLFGFAHIFEIEDEAMAWEFAAMAVQHLAALGCYKAPSPIENGPVSFLAIMAIQHHRA